MTLLNGILAFGALAFTVPLAIHLLFRSRFRTVEWGAMHLLDAVVRINRRRVQLLHLLLLLVRCLLPVLLAFCLARPLLTGFQSLPGDAPQSIVLVVDDSRSMAVRDSSGLSRLDRVKQGFSELLASLTRRDEVILIRSSQVTSTPEPGSVQSASQSLRQIRADFGPVDLGRMMQSAVEAADAAAHSQRRIIVASDFQTQLVSDAVIESLSRMTRRIEEKTIRPVVSFWNLGGDSEQLENVSIDSVLVDSTAVVAGRTANYSAELRNASDRPVRDLRVVWAIDEKPLAPVLVNLPPRSSVTHRLSRSIDEAGVHQVSVALEQGDALVEDNRRAIGVDVIREVRVLMVDGQPSPRPLQGETDFLAIALSPFAFGGEDQPDAVRTTVVNSSQMLGVIETDPPDVIVLANVSEFSNTARSAVARFVLDGGGLILFDGDQVRPDVYNESWQCEAGSWTLPGTLGQRVGSAWEPDSGSEVGTYPVGNRNSQFSPWDVLGKSEQRPFVDLKVSAYRKLGISKERTDGDSPTIVLLSLANGDPLVLSAKCERGTVVQFSIPCDAEWSNLPTRLVYLPMLQQLVLDLAGSRRKTTLDVGEEIVVMMSDLTATLPDGATRDPDQKNSVSVKYPGGTEELLAPTEDTLSQVVATTDVGPGLYQFIHRVPLEGEEPLLKRVNRVVEVPPVESELRDVESARLKSAAASLDGKVFEDLNQLQQDDQTRRYGREIWRWLLVGLCLALVVELLLQQIAVRVSTGRAA